MTPSEALCARGAEGFTLSLLSGRGGGSSSSSDVQRGPARSEGLDEIKFLVGQPLDGSGTKPEGRPQVAADATALAGPGDLIFIVASREAARALPEVNVPVDLAVTGLDDEVALETGPRRSEPTARWRPAAPKG